MARLNQVDRVESLRRKQAEITEKLRVAEEATKKLDRENTQRRHEIAGSIVLSALARDPQSDFAQAVIGVLESGIRNQAHRAFFPELGSFRLTSEQPPKPEKRLRTKAATARGA